MDVKYYKLQDLVIETFDLDAPVEIEKGVLYLDTTSRDVLLQLKLNVLGVDTRLLSSVSLLIDCMDDAGEIITDISPFTFTFRDIFLNKSKTFGEDNPILIDRRIRRVKVGIQRVVFTDSTTWTPTGNQFTPPKQELINSLTPELVEQFHRDIRHLSPHAKESYKFIPKQLDTYWLCTCRRPNKSNVETCLRCGLSKNKVFCVSEDIVQANLVKYKEQIRQEQEKARIASEQARLEALEKAQKEEEHKANLREQEKARSKRRTTLLVMSSLVGLLIAVFLFAILPAIKYSQASTYLANKNYNYAIYVFDSLGNYKNSKEMVSEANYQKAIDFLTNKNFDDAIKTFSYIEVYRDSSTKEMEAIYQAAEAYFQEKKFPEAISLFSQLGDFNDSIDRLQHSQWLLANQYLIDENFAQAIEILETLDDYEDSTKLLRDAKYFFAIEQYELGEFASANVIFQGISSYKDSYSYLKKLKFLNGIQGKWFQDTVSGWKILRFVGWNYFASRADGKGWYENKFSESSLTDYGLLISENDLLFPLEYNHSKQTLVLIANNGKTIDYARK